MNRVVALAPGCPSGVGPEVTARALHELPASPGVRFLYTGPQSLLLEGARRARVPAMAMSDTVEIGAHVVSCESDVDETLPLAGKPDARALVMQRDGLLDAIRAAKEGRAHAIVTAPIRKAALTDVDGGPFPGQTELVHHHLARDANPPLMAFEGGPFLLGLLTVHVPLCEVSRTITEALVENALSRLYEAVRAQRAVSEAQPARIVVLGVNPHAGEGGLLGDDETRVLAPAIARLRSATLDVTDPIPADGFFADVARDGFTAPDAVLAAHHDQGLAPYKLLARGHGVNVTLGLRVPRTSPDHGTADAIAGKQKASAESMRAAMASAIRLLRLPLSPPLQPSAFV
jgi:4-hydroxythreonine-4-phosphate dehydrogenase